VTTSTNTARAASNRSSESSDSTTSQRDSIYWDGSGMEDEAPADDVQAPAPQQPRPVVGTPPAQQRRTATPAPQVVETPRRTATVPKPNVARQADTAPPPPSRQGIKWGQEETKTEAKRPLTWGQQDKPAIVGSEPGSSQVRTGVQSAAPSPPTASQPQTPSQSADRKLQWGRSE
jgi:hypothetical protein